MILSHLHFDHVGGLLPTYAEQQRGRHDLVFPNAQFLVGREAWERALHPHPRDKSSFIPGLTDKLLQSGRLKVLAGEDLPDNLKGKFEFVSTSGHTPGQMHALFVGAKQKVFFCGDLVPGRAWVHLPITMGYDRYPELLIDEKTDIFARAEKEDWLLFFTHDPEVSASHLHRTHAGKYEPRAAQAEFDRATM